MEFALSTILLIIVAFFLFREDARNRSDIQLLHKALASQSAKLVADELAQKEAEQSIYQELLETQASLAEVSKLLQEFREEEEDIPPPKVPIDINRRRPVHVHLPLD